MSGELPARGAPRARAVAGAPVDALVAGADELARRWTIALIRARPLERLGEIPLEEHVRQGPALCAQIARALRSDAELERLISAGPPAGGDGLTPAPRIDLLAGARDAEDAVIAAEALRGVLWEALLDELDGPVFDRSAAMLLGDLCDRLAYVCARTLAASLAAAQAPPVAQAAPPPARRAVAEFEPAPSGSRSVLIVDEREQGPVRPAGATRSAGAGDDAAAAAEAPEPVEPRRPRARPLPWDQAPRTARSGEPSPQSGAQMRVSRRSEERVDERA